MSCLCHVKIGHMEGNDHKHTWTDACMSCHVSELFKFLKILNYLSV